MFRRTAIAVGVNFVVAVALLATGVGSPAGVQRGGDGERWATGPTLPADVADEGETAVTGLTAPGTAQTEAPLDALAEPVSSAATSGAAPSAPGRTSVAAVALSAGRPSRPTGRIVETSDNAGAFTYAADGNHTGTSSISDEADDLFRFEAYVTPKQADRVAGVRMNLVNRSGGPVEFPGGLRVVLRLKHTESGDERAVELATPEITKLGDGGSVAMTGDVVLDKYGAYEYVATVLVDYGA